ncbi:MAG: hypothetical protein WAU01_16650, partial [Saprospiraceae bacterium]
FMAKIAFNYDRKESDMKLVSEELLKDIQPQNPKLKIIASELQANISGTISEKDKGIILWKWFVISALIFLALEIMLLRFYNP